jgi:large subunit ribosomal protein L15
MQANQLRPAKGARHARKRIGRGNASGHGTYSGRGGKGQYARNTVRRDFEGGQTPLLRRLPRKRGFKNPFRVEYQPVNLVDLARFEEGAEVTPEALRDAGILTSIRKPIKILATGDIDAKLTVKAHKFSLAAREKIEAAGGTAVEIGTDGDSK